MKNTIDILPDYLQIVKEILQRYFSVNTTVWVFGSRVTGKGDDGSSRGAECKETAALLGAASSNDEYLSEHR